MEKPTKVVISLDDIVMKIAEINYDYQVAAAKQSLAESVHEKALATGKMEILSWILSTAKKGNDGNDM